MQTWLNTSSGATYYFNKNFNVWADYHINLLDDKIRHRWVGSDGQAAVGVTYQF
jgi:outer membrane pore protein F